MNKCIAIVFLLFFSLFSASGWTPVITDYSKSKYGAAAQNWDVTEDDNGFIYVANNRGLLQFDGNSWRFHPCGMVRSLYYSSDGVLYFGSYNSFGYFSYSCENGWNVVRLSNDICKEVGNFSDIWNIHEIDKVIYFVSYNNIFKKVGEDISVVRSDARILCSNVIDGVLYAHVEGKGLFLLAGAGLIPVKGTEKLADSDVKGMFLHEDKILLVTAMDGIYEYSDGNMDRIKTSADDIMCSNQTYCADMSDSHLFIGTIKDGLLAVNLKNRNISQINVASGLQNNTIHCIHATPKGNLWLGLGNGISYVNFDSPISSLYSVNDNYGLGYTSIIYDDKLYIGTNQGLYFTSWPVIAPASSSLSQVLGIDGQIWSLQTIDDRLVCGCNIGAFIVEGDKASPIASFDGFWNFQKIPQRNDIMLAGTYNGLVIFTRSSDNDSWSFGWKIEGLDKSCVHVIYDRNNKGWWIDYGMGVCRVDISQDYRYVEDIHEYSNTLPNMPFIMRDGSIMLEHKGRRFIQNDRYGNIWYIADGRLYRDYIDDGKARTDSLVAILTEGHLIELNENVYTADANTAIIAASDGFFKYELSDEPYVKIDDRFDLSIRSLSITSSRYQKDFYFKPSSSFNISIPYDQEAVYRFETNTIISPYSKIDYKWSLLPVNPVSVPLDHSGVKEFNGLAEGTYVFTVDAYDQITGESYTDSVKFIITPPWYRSILAKIIYVLLVLGMFACVFISMKSYFNHQTRARLYAQKMESRRIILALKNQKLEESIKLKSNEISNTMLNVIQKRELLSQILNESKKIAQVLDEAESDPSKIDDAKKIVNKVSNQLRHNIKDDDSWKKLEDNFNIVHQDFITRLKKEYPVLNYTDIKLAVYIRMNLLTKEIAPLLNISERGLESARYRLRKKLGLKNMERLSDFLFKF